MVYQISAILLDKIDFREYDQLLTFYTQERGKLELLGKGVKKIKAKLAPHLKIFSILSLGVAASKKESWDRIIDVETIKDFSNLRQDFETLMLGFYLLEIFNSLIDYHLPLEELWQWLNQALNRLNQLASHHPKNLSLWQHFFEWELLKILGYEPEISQCVRCQKKLQANQKLFFSPKQGGLLDEKCYNKKSQAQPLTADLWKILTWLQKGNHCFLQRVFLSRSQAKALQKILPPFVQEITNQKINSLSFLP